MRYSRSASVPPDGVTLAASAPLCVARASHPR